MSVFKWVELPARGRRNRRGPGQKPADDVDIVALFGMAEDCRNSGQLSKAIAYYEKVVSFGSGLLDAWMGLGDSLVRIDEVAKANNVAEEALQRYGLAGSLYGLKALVLLHDGQEVESFRYSDISLQQDEAGWYPWLVRGEILLMQGSRSARAQNAGYCFERSANLAEKQWVACLWAGIVCLVNQHPALAAAYLAESAHLNPLNAFTWSKLGDAFRTLRFFDQAKFYYEQALDVDPESESARRGLADARASRSRISNLIDVGSARARWARMFGLHRKRADRRD